MAKMSIDEFNRKLSEKLGENEDLAIELMEDVSDSFKDDSKEKDEEIGRLNGELADLKSKYKERFLTKDATAENTIVQNPTNTILNEVEQPKEPRKFEDLFNEKGELK